MEWHPEVFRMAPLRMAEAQFRWSANQECPALNQECPALCMPVYTWRCCLQ